MRFLTTHRVGHGPGTVPAMTNYSTRLHGIGVNLEGYRREPVHFWGWRLIFKIICNWNGSLQWSRTTKVTDAESADLSGQASG